MKHFLKYDIISKVNNIQKQVDNGSIIEVKILQVNKIDNIITKCMLQVEQSLKHSTHSHLWSLRLAFTILGVRH